MIVKLKNAHYQPLLRTKLRTKHAETKESRYLRKEERNLEL